jgi:hypothetical protein
VKDRQPWSVRGVAREARAKAARAAHRRHMTIGEWLTETVICAADRDLGEAETQTTQANLPATTDRSPELAGALGALVQHLENGGNEGALTTRIDRTEAVLTGRMEQIAAAMYGVMQTVERNAAKPVEIDHRAQAIAEEQARIAEQIAAIASAEGRRQEQMGAIADALTMLATKVDTPRPEPEPAPLAPAEPEPLQVEPVQVEPVQAAQAQPVPMQSAPMAQPATANSAVVQQQPVVQPEPAPDVVMPAAQPASAPQQIGGTVKPRQMQTTPRHTDPRAEEVAAQIRQSAMQPPSMPDNEDDEPRRRGLLGRLFNRD